MKGFYAIYRKEMGHYFVSPIAYAIIGLFVLIAATLFYIFLRTEMIQSMQAQYQSMQSGMPMEIDVPANVMRAFFFWLFILALFLTPMLTMGVFADERKRGTMELLMTSPITEAQIVLGKFAASLTLFALMLLPTLSFLVFMYLHSDPMPPWRVLWCGYAGIMLLGGSLLALGSFISSLTENQIIAAVLSFVLLMLVWLLSVGQSFGGWIGNTLAYLSFFTHYEDFTRGIIDTTALVYYFSIMVFFVFLTVRSVDSMRWRRA
ncbi:MAG TPA: ABC transporter permease subunit [Candidatus Acidoferrales bacterium]|nr:ABC transporter permease subunit [Candidatus Acidoferrales bacterium]